MWRALITQKRFSFGYGENEDAKPGSMAIFCALCAQPGINLPEDWREYENRCVHRYHYMEATNILFQQKPFYARLYDGWQLPSGAHEDEEP
jgi:hypothetical protein